MEWVAPTIRSLVMGSHGCFYLHLLCSLSTLTIIHTFTYLYTHVLMLLQSFNMYMASLRSVSDCFNSSHPFCLHLELPHPLTKLKIPTTNYYRNFPGCMLVGPSALRLQYSWSIAQKTFVNYCLIFKFQGRGENPNAGWIVVQTR